MGGGMLDTHTVGSSAILLAACHQSQFNVKCLNGMDPWAYGITRIIERYYKKGEVPTYTQLYEDTKAYIVQKMRDGELNNTLTKTSYLGPSPDPSHPLPRDSPPGFSSHQDPQLICSDGYVDPSVERFCSPLKGLGHNAGEF